MSDNTSGGAVELGFDDGLIGFMVVIHEKDIDFSTCFAEVVSRPLACELAEMMFPAYPSADIRIVPVGLPSDKRAKAHESTKRLEIRLAEARKSTSPGHAFLEALHQRTDEAPRA
ncbi:MAG: hypothetical protein JKY58_12430 [Pseudomonas sp.]|nr:hypothetical protein [Pseudomonas sp.]